MLATFALHRLQPCKDEVATLTKNAALAHTVPMPGAYTMHLARARDMAARQAPECWPPTQQERYGADGRRLHALSPVRRATVMAASPDTIGPSLRDYCHVSMHVGSGLKHNVVPAMTCSLQQAACELVKQQDVDSWAHATTRAASGLL
jgi:hypothetical protein